MKYIDILMFVFCFNVGLYFMSAVGIFNALGGTYDMSAETKWLESYSDTAQNQSLAWSNPDVLDYMLALGVGIWTALTTVFTILFQVVLLAPTLIQLHVPPTIAIILSMPIYLIYLWGIIQFLSGRSGRNME